ncbi:hypothetical protein KC19_VG070400 [Ceratodon purpureus]|uniref:Uncharacterized protein n=1 Tax=Ceratodon purpureus TaxID=3225 RepID=A0A8T0HMS5_CERPU|nr:hypothetical protein KC19_VG070400 [Ceratodon purpureus]
MGPSLQWTLILHVCFCSLSTRQEDFRGRFWFAKPQRPSAKDPTSELQAAVPCAHRLG